jgi:hypothetical protein
MERQISILCWNLTDLKFNFSFVTYVLALSVVYIEHAESICAHRLKYQSSWTEDFQTVEIKYKSEIAGRFWYDTSMSNFVKIFFFMCDITIV